jgi:hypothetical protein
MHTEEHKNSSKKLQQLSNTKKHQQSYDEKMRKIKFKNVEQHSAL